MAITNLIINGSFETGTLVPFVTANAVIDATNSHSGLFSARLLGEIATAFVAQQVPAAPGDSFELLVSLTRTPDSPSPPIAISVSYLNAANVLVATALMTSIAAGRLPSSSTNDWTEIYETTTLAPPGTTSAVVIIFKLPLAGSSDVLVDDIALLRSNGVPGPTGPTGPTGA
ncbi:NTTRR-F1 domain, partial [Aneurinibacillus migulanus]